MDVIMSFTSAGKLDEAYPGAGQVIHVHTMYYDKITDYMVTFP